MSILTLVLVFVVWSVQTHMVHDIRYFDEAVQTRLHHRIQVLLVQDMPRDMREMYWAL